MSLVQSARRGILLVVIAGFSHATAAPQPRESSSSSVHLAKACTLHTRPEKVNVMELMERGDFDMQVGQYPQAIAAFERVLQTDCEFTAVWGKLAFLYLKQGNSAKAVEAFKKAKLVTDANGGIVTRNALGRSLFQ